MIHEDQIPIDSGVVRALIHSQFPRWDHEPVVALETVGTVNAIFRIGQHLAARFPLRATDPVVELNRLRTEADAMMELSSRSPFPTPMPVAIGYPGDSFPLPWSVQTWLPGATATPTGTATSSAFAEDLSTLILALRSTDTHGRRFTGSGRGGRLRDHDHWVSHCFSESEALLDVRRLRALWDRLRDLPRSGPDVMSHGDLIPANLLVRDDRLVGVLDGGGFSPADPALDLVAGWHLLHTDARNAFRADLDCDDVEWGRGAGWALEQSIGLVWYYRTSSPSMSALGANTLERLLDDCDN
jgi:aminoglycoside phosphotransferase (APT) family kinase protein